MNRRESKIIFAYMQKILSSKKDDRRLLSIVCSWLWENADGIGLNIDGEQSFELLSEFPKAVEKRQVTREMFLTTRKMITELLAGTTTRKIISGAAGIKCVEILSDSLKLDPQDVEIFSIFYRYNIDDVLESFVDEMCKNFIGVADIVSILTGMNHREVTRRLSLEGRLIQMGLLETNGSSGRYLSSYFKIPKPIIRGLKNFHLNKSNLKQLLIGKTSQSNLTWDDYEHQGKTRDMIASFTEHAVRNQAASINILIWGSPGTGKTEFCKMLANHLGIELFSIGEKCEDGLEPTRDERIQALQLAQNLMREQNQALLLFDETDDLLQPRESGSLLNSQLHHSKIFMNRLFEENPVPTIWTLNNINLLDEAILRRMSLVVEFEKPPRKNRANILSRILKRHDIELSAEEIAPVLDINVAPAVLDNAVRFAQISGKGKEGLTFALDGLSQALGTRTERIRQNTGHYNHHLVNSDLDLNNLAERLTAQQTRNFSICLYGPPGTGKSEYVCYLAEKLSMEPQVVRASDLLGSFVGETEQAIAKAFRNAREQETFLIFDEADSLLSDRSDARQSWQVSQVNEMLTWMEHHPLPFACTTNLRERLDPASLRRFTFKCRLDCMTAEQSRRSFLHFFGYFFPPDTLIPQYLTPGDFSVVKRKAEILGALQDPHQVCELLQQEVDAKKMNSQQKIGFCV
jgi:SpoVK/Ycf46/Vps4 family AAA+-type ATPase